MIKIMIDSTCDIDDKYIKEYDIKTLPLRIIYDDKDYLDKLTITPDEVYDLMKKGIYPKTSQPLPKDVYDLFDKELREGNDIIFIAFSSRMSGTYQEVLSIADSLKEKYTERKIQVIDSLGGTAGTGLIVLQAARMAQKGFRFEDIVDKTEEMVSHIKYAFTLANLDAIIKGGRISRTYGIIGNMLDIKPVLHVNDGNMEVIKKIRGRKNSLREIVNMVLNGVEKFPDQTIGISYAAEENAAFMVRDMLKEKLHTEKFMITKIGSVLGVHIGSGGVGIFYFDNKIDNYLL